MTDTNYGILLKKETTVVGEVTDMSFPEIIREDIEKTNHSSGGLKEFISSGLKEISEFTVSLNTVQAQFTAIEADVSAGTIATYHIHFPVALGITNWVFSAFPKRIAMQGADAQSPDVLKMDVVFRPTGDILFSGSGV